MWATVLGACFGKSSITTVPFFANCRATSGLAAKARVGHLKLRTRNRAATPIPFWTSKRFTENLLYKLVDDDALDAIALLDFLHLIHPLNDPPKHAVVAVQLFIIHEIDEKLAIAGIGARCAERQGDGARQIGEVVPLERNGLPRSAGA